MLSLIASLVLARANFAPPLVLVHYMPWFETKAVSGHWGWHWTMNHFDGDHAIASRYRPIIGAYDSSDPDALECQTLQMKIAGIDGVVIDWYGTKDLYDYGIIHRNAQRLVEACTKAGLKFCIMLEDQVVPNLVKAGKSTPDEYAKSAMDWLDSKWFNRPNYIRWDGKPVLLLFGPQYYKDDDLGTVLGRKISLLTEHNRRGSAVGGFGWPEPQVGNEESGKHLLAFDARAREWPVSMSVAYPRFEDIYKQAGVGPGYGEILDRDGATFRETFTMAEGAGTPFLQIATWNDWGEGTQIEPSEEFGYRDLALIYSHVAARAAKYPYQPKDLRLPARLYKARKNHLSPELNRVARALQRGRPSEAEKILNDLGD